MLGDNGRHVNRMCALQWAANFKFLGTAFGLVSLKVMVLLKLVTFFR